MRTKLSIFAVASIVGLAAIPQASFAQEATIIQAAIVGEESANERINFSGKLRMLSQRIPSAACHLYSGIDSEGAAKLLEGSVAEFNRILSALEFGDGELNIQSAESRRLTIAKIHETNEAWTPFATAASGIASSKDTANLEVVLGTNVVLLGSAQSLVSELVEQYSTSPNTTQAELLLVDIAGRQRMLLQKMSKESCMISASTGGPEAVETLKGTMQIFEMSREDLRFGMPELGIRKPPTSSISSGLGDVLTQWNAVKPLLEATLEGAELDTEAQVRKFQALNSTMATMNSVVGLYAQASEHEA